ncbi:MAG: hypothetical protein QXY87_11340 [Saccharolobus sp.]|uniref:Uncharacterized protein n=1 Tax=Saccharolobus shibatae (strain ATCC 51178 / DSM 5389 / JCM 8931 / NBRC 15437 / B12) TaxID=523848 RepID=A0A8F5GTJ5_SACSH|nr:hypothetical protein [Saccharolobus shibatae]MCH4816463.1 hypothetical protein [Saccharolobus shibatae]QXJ29024.1 hypothetical protein J5U23_01893 [Saccharolobus shibatae B12]
MDKILVSKNELREDDLINDYLMEMVKKLDQKVISARRNVEINGILSPFYLDLEKEIRLIFIYEEQTLTYLNSHKENIKKIKELRRKDVKIILLVSEMSQLDLNKVLNLCESKIIPNVSITKGEVKSVSACKELEIHGYQGWILKDFEE